MEQRTRAASLQRRGALVRCRHASACASCAEPRCCTCATGADLGLPSATAQASAGGAAGRGALGRRSARPDVVFASLAGCRVSTHFGRARRRRGVRPPAVPVARRTPRGVTPGHVAPLRWAPVAQCAPRPRRAAALQRDEGIRSRHRRAAAPPPRRADRGAPAARRGEEGASTAPAGKGGDLARVDDLIAWPSARRPPSVTTEPHRRGNRGASSSTQRALPRRRPRRPRPCAGHGVGADVGAARWAPGVEGIDSALPRAAISRARRRRLGEPAQRGRDARSARIGEHRGHPGCGRARRAWPVLGSARRSPRYRLAPRDPGGEVARPTDLGDLPRRDQELGPQAATHLVRASSSFHAARHVAARPISATWRIDPRAAAAKTALGGMRCVRSPLPGRPPRPGWLRHRCSGSAARSRPGREHRPSARTRGPARPTPGPKWLRQKSHALRWPRAWPGGLQIRHNPRTCRAQQAQVTSRCSRR